MLSRNILRQSYNCTKGRYFTSSALSFNLFGGKKVVNQTQLNAPTGKGESTTNPADMIKRNDILMFSQKPINYIETVKSNGFHLANNLLITSPDKEGNIIGTLLLDSETFEINLSKPNKGFDIINGFIIDFHEDVLQIFNKIHPKPEICVVGLGCKSRMLSDSTKKYFSNLGIQVDHSDSNNAAQIFDLLATERPNVIAALLLPPNI
ncbi:uncharacterized protein AC631_01614 [Debaryomyces fabryi]|uniref:NADH dehydrogenase [ubiquinone] 1 alpha subcomplex assembly factor 3 n=1 Tax=Debaryomyces fabryi TaxID=58627 RepID=A0A0V1Q2D4_9ASCO|nr:uncharacterized protein AC631_01614 [Debaryomyces fabryi]KSA02627.1 hypothetical protein AC631_01614 [Debaryomyces fabryi]CUM45737.1 unnamed protein product [Debaryomyces fabryi]